MDVDISQMLELSDKDFKLTSKKKKKVNSMPEQMGNFSRKMKTTTNSPMNWGLTWILLTHSFISSTTSIILILPKILN